MWAQHPWCHCFLCLPAAVEKITVWWISTFRKTGPWWTESMCDATLSRIVSWNYLKCLCSSLKRSSERLMMLRNLIRVCLCDFDLMFIRSYVPGCELVLPYLIIFHQLHVSTSCMAANIVHFVIKAPCSQEVYLLIWQFKLDMKTSQPQHFNSTNCKTSCIIWKLVKNSV